MVDELTLSYTVQVKNVFLTANLLDTDDLCSDLLTWKVLVTIFMGII